MNNNPMLIRSTDMKDVYMINEFNNIGVDELDLSGNNVYTPCVTMGSYIVDEYSTLDNANKVLDMIIEQYKKFLITLSTGENIELYYIFQMPKDEELTINR